MVAPDTALFGQILLRKDPPFYLCTRYLVLQVATGAMHVFRFKFKPNSGQFYPHLSDKQALLMSRPDTNGYLYPYLKFLWKQTGQVRPKNTTLKEDLMTCFQYWETAFGAQDSIVICLEVE